MLEQTVAEILRERNWVTLPASEVNWCEVDDQHVYCCVRPEAILRHPIAKGALFQRNGCIYEVCMVSNVEASIGEHWLLIYTHSRIDTDAMTKEEWHELYS